MVEIIEEGSQQVQQASENDDSEMTSSSSQIIGVPQLEDDHRDDTKAFIERIDKHLIEFMLERTDRLGKDDVEESDRRFVDPFICPICLSISNRAIQCSSC